MPGSELPADNIPRAIVQRVESEIDGNTATTTIQLGGQRYSPENFYNHVLQLVDNYYYLKSATSLTKCYRLKRNVLLIRNPPIQSARPFQCAYHPLTP